MSFVTFEGMEGSGKTTQVKALTAHYEKKGLRVFSTREPGGTTLGNELRALLLQSRKEPVDRMAELFMLEAARAQHVSHVLKEALSENDLVFCDRFADASLAYQGGGRKIDLSFVRQANRLATDGLVPDLTFLLDMPIEVGLERALKRIAQESGTPEDRFEREAREFHQRVRDTYLQIAKEEPNRFFVIQADKSPQEIQREIITRIDSMVEQGRS